MYSIKNIYIKKGLAIINRYLEKQNKTKKQLEATNMARFLVLTVGMSAASELKERNS